MGGKCTYTNTTKISDNLLKFEKVIGRKELVFQAAIISVDNNLRLYDILQWDKNRSDGYYRIMQQWDKLTSLYWP